VNINISKTRKYTKKASIIAKLKWTACILVFPNLTSEEKGFFNLNLYSAFKCNKLLFSDIKYTRQACCSVDNEFGPHLCYRLKLNDLTRHFYSDQRRRHCGKVGLSACKVSADMYL
jgi:hypothetical protein